MQRTRDLSSRLPTYQQPSRAGVGRVQQQLQRELVENRSFNTRGSLLRYPTCAITTALCACQLAGRANSNGRLRRFSPFERSAIITWTRPGGGGGRTSLRDLRGGITAVGRPVAPPRGPCDGVETRTTREMTTNRAWTSEVAWLRCGRREMVHSETGFSNKVIVHMHANHLKPQLPHSRRDRLHVMPSRRAARLDSRSDQTCGRSRPRRLDSG